MRRNQTNQELDERADRFNEAFAGVTRAEAIADPENVVVVCLEYKEGDELDMDDNRIGRCRDCHCRIQYRPQNESFREKWCIGCWNRRHPEGPIVLAQWLRP